MCKKKALFIDDDQDILNIVPVVLEEENIEVIATNDLALSQNCQ